MTTDGQRSGGFRAYFEPPVVLSMAFILFILVRYMEWNHRLDIAKTIRLEFLIGIFMIGVATMMVGSGQVKFGESRLVVFGAVALVLVIEMGVPFALNPVLAKDTAFNRGVKFAMLTYFTATMVRSPKTMRWFIAAYIFSLFYLTQESFRGGLDGSMVWENQGIPRLHGSVPSVNHPNSLGSAILGIVPFIIFIAPEIRRWWLKMALLGITPMAAMVILWSGSRTAYVGFIALLVLWFALSKHKKRLLVLMVVAGFVLIPLIPDDFMQRFESITHSGTEGGDGSKHERMFLNRLAWETFLANPMGIGVESFRNVSVAYLPYAMEVHCLYLQILCHVGVQGMIAFVFFVGATMVTLFQARRAYLGQVAMLTRCVRRTRPPPAVRAAMGRHVRDMNFLVAVCNATLVFLINRLLVGVFSQDLYEIYWWFGAGVAISMIEMRSTAAARARALVAAAETAPQASDPADPLVAPGAVRAGA
ncbi:O-antigen ligase family protein [bacterium]|nr:O-antigen ligase family protein [bacterium]